MSHTKDSLDTMVESLLLPAAPGEVGSALALVLVFDHAPLVAVDDLDVSDAPSPAIVARVAMGVDPQVRVADQAWHALPALLRSIAERIENGALEAPAKRGERGH